MPYELSMWPEEIIELNRELASGLHPKLEERLKEIGGHESNFIERFAIIATYCEVALDGMYTSDQMVAMVGMVFLPRLEKKRERGDGIIVVH